MFKTGDIVYWTGKEYSGSDDWDWHGRLYLNTPYEVHAVTNGRFQGKDIQSIDLGDYWYHADRFTTDQNFKDKERLKKLDRCLR